MTDFAPYLAGEITDWMSQGVDMPVAPGTIYVALFDSTGTEVSGDFVNGRVPMTAGTDWTRTNTAFENAVEVNFGDASVDVSDIQDVALLDSDTGGSNNELARYTLDSAPILAGAGTRVFFEAGQLSFDVQD